jgi:hypothetical protein
VNVTPAKRALWIAATAVAVTFGIGWFYVPTDPGQATCDKLKYGMSEAEVIEVIGRKWDICGGGPVGNLKMHKTAQWSGSQGTIVVLFEDDQYSRLYEAEFIPSGLTWWDRLLKRIGW